MKLKEAKEITGGLSNPEKMPGYSYNLPPEACKVGSRLYKIEGTVCRDCYARKGRYNFQNVKDAMMRRFKAIRHPSWIFAMTTLIEHYCKDEPYFRFHDSGDVQDVLHLSNIITICNKLKHINFWLPTIEASLINTCMQRGLVDIPDNLTVRISTPKIDRAPGAFHSAVAEYNKLCTSSVTTDADKYPNSIICQASLNHTNCGDCRKCWDNDFKHIVYVKH